MIRKSIRPRAERFLAMATNANKVLLDKMLLVFWIGRALLTENVCATVGTLGVVDLRKKDRLAV